MGAVSLLLAVLLPYSLANIAQTPVGNNKYHGQYQPVHHTEYKQTSYKQGTYHVGCRDMTEAWQQWEGGAQGNIRVNRKPHSAPVDNWEMELVFNKPLAGLDVFNGVVDSHTGSKFKVVPAKWNRQLNPGQETLVNVKATFTPGSEPAILESIQVNGKYHSCGNTTASASPFIPAVVSTKGVRTYTHPAWPSKVLGLYVLLADDDEDGFSSDSDSWTPELYEWQQEASNVLFFTFIHPGTMEVPPAFTKLAATRGSDEPGSVPSNTVILFAIGGYAYSLKPNPWHWLESQEAAEEMAETVAEWPEAYGCDGIDLDLEEGAGARQNAGTNMVHFIRRLRELKPNIIISQPTYGYPQVKAEIDVINASWDADGNTPSPRLADAIGLMVYEGTQSLNYVKNYNDGPGRWQGFPMTCSAPKNTILLGAKGQSSSSNIIKLANEAVSQDLLGIMVWYASVKNGFDYSPVWDASTKDDSISGYKQAMTIFDNAMAATKTDVDNDTVVEVVVEDMEAIVEVAQGVAGEMEELPTH